MTQNPWRGLNVNHDGPYVLDADRPFVEAFNTALPRGAMPDTPSQFHIEGHLVPEPWLGRRDAPVCLLLLNPGVDQGDFAVHRDAHYRSRLAAAISDDHAPHFHLSDAAATPGRRWWVRALSSLQGALDVHDPGTLHDAVSAIQLFPYHSRKLGHLGVRVPSQAASIARVHEHLARRTILVVRSWISWIGVVPALSDPRHADHVFPFGGRRLHLHGTWLGGQAAFDTIVEAVRPRVRGR
jgi:hypothetical protein